MTFQALQERLNNLAEQVRDTIFGLIVKKASPEALVRTLYVGISAIAEVGLNYCADPSMDSPREAAREVTETIERLQASWLDLDIAAVLKAWAQADAKPHVEAEASGSRPGDGSQVSCPAEEDRSQGVFGEMVEPYGVGGAHQDLGRQGLWVGLSSNRRLQGKVPCG